MAASTPPNYHLGSAHVVPKGQRQFKKHKLLPRPQTDRGTDDAWSRPRKCDLTVDISASAGSSPSLPSSPQTLKHQPKRMGTGPDLPPTPPIQSRNSSGSHVEVLSSPTTALGNMQAPQGALKRPPATPPDQRSPPTPDVTPPQPSHLTKAIRPAAWDRGTTTAPRLSESRTDSFKTAPEEPLLSEDDDIKSTRRPTWSSSRTSQSTIVVNDARAIQPHDLDVALERLKRTPAENQRQRSSRSKGSWHPSKDAGFEWDVDVQKISVRKRRPAQSTSRNDGMRDTVIEHNIVTSTSATKAVRNMQLQEAVVLQDSPKARSDRDTLPSELSKSERSVKVDTRRSSGTSARSGSTVVEVLLVDGPPRRERTLRHVRKQNALREPVYDCIGSNGDGSSPSHISTPPNGRKRPRLENSRRHESYASNTTSRSLSSGKARREIWKSGAIPVVVIPDRRSSHKPKSSKEPSLRSTSSRRSRRSGSISSFPPDDSPFNEATPVFERSSRRGRALSESSRSDQRTIDFPPTIPTRSSSLSAPTSRNVSRAGSMTSKSVKTRTSLQQKLDDRDDEAVKVIIMPTPPPEPTLASPKVRRFEDDDAHDVLNAERHDDGLSPRKIPSRNTPFSVASQDTSCTVPELSEALAVHMYSHQNSSVLMVNYSRPPSDAFESAQSEKEAYQPTAEVVPKITTTGPNPQAPVTPPQRQFAFNDVDSPLRNPRAPPQPPRHPPEINFIPATPSGMTPAQEKTAQLGNYFETEVDRPPQRPSLVKRALSRRRYSVDHPPTVSKMPGFLIRSLSLSRNDHKSREGISNERSNLDMEESPKYPKADDMPVEQDKLHPFWRPQLPDDQGNDELAPRPRGRSGYGDEIPRPPPVGKRTQVRNRSLSTRARKVFAVLPAPEEKRHTVNYIHEPERRTIRRTPSGNLRVMRHRASAESLTGPISLHGKTQPTHESRRGFWRSPSLSRRVSQDGPRRFSIGSTLEDIQQIPQFLSERRRERRSQQLRQKISGPREVRDGVGDVIRCGNAGLRHGVPRHF